MRYLTSNGTTSSTITYLKDILKFNFNIEYNRIPYLEFGCNSLIEDMRLDEAQLIVTTKVQEVIQRINERNNTTLHVDDIKLVNNKNIELVLSIGNLTMSTII